MASGNAAASSTSAKSKPERLPITVSKPSPYTFDLGRLLAKDPNPLLIPTTIPLNDSLKATARDGAQCLLNQLLTACPITSSTKDGILLTLPPPNTLLPRYKPVPTAKPPTKWDLFARKKGIGKYNTKPGTVLADKERRKKIVYDETTGEWVPRWGYKGKNKAEEENWLVEVPEKEWKKEEKTEQNIRGMNRTERKERIRRNERKMRANERRSRKSGG